MSRGPTNPRPVPAARPASPPLVDAAPARSPRPRDAAPAMRPRTAGVAWLWGAILLPALAGGSLDHVIADDDAHDLVEHQGERSFHSTGLRAEYTLSDRTAGHRHAFRAWTVGHANLWIVELGRMLEASLESADVQDAFVELRRRGQGLGSPDVVLGFDVVDYAFDDFAAHLTLDVTVETGVGAPVRKRYRASGESQGGKMVLGGVFAMRTAVQQSTKSAFDDVLGRLIADLDEVTRPTAMP